MADQAGCGICDWCTGTTTSQRCPHNYACCRNCFTCQAAIKGLPKGSPEWVAEVIRTGQEGMRELLDALRDEIPPEQPNLKGIK